jgi:hypothetical protein
MLLRCLGGRFTGDGTRKEDIDKRVRGGRYERAVNGGQRTTRCTNATDTDPPRSRKRACCRFSRCALLSSAETPSLACCSAASIVARSLNACRGMLLDHVTMHARIRARHPAPCMSQPILWRRFAGQEQRPTAAKRLSSLDQLPSNSTQHPGAARDFVDAIVDTLSEITVTSWPGPGRIPFKNKPGGFLHSKLPCHHSERGIRWMLMV